MQRVNTLEFNDYKEILKRQWKLNKANNKEITLKFLAIQLDLQHSYLSKFFNHEEIHLSEDNLYTLASILDFSESDIEYIFLLRSYALSTNDQKKEFLYKRIKKMQLRYQVGEEVNISSKLDLEMQYLLESNYILIHVALTLKKYRENPHLLCDIFGFTINELKNYYRTLENIGFIDLGENSLDVKEVRFKKLHYGKTHPLMRIHQHILKGKINDRLRYTQEKDKESFMATFSFDERSFLLAKDEFKNFFNRISHIQANSSPQNIYQLNFDLFKWF